MAGFANTGRKRRGVSERVGQPVNEYVHGGRINEWANQWERWYVFERRVMHPPPVDVMIRSPFSALCGFVLPPSSSSPHPAKITGVGVAGAIVLEEKKGGIWRQETWV